MATDDNNQSAPQTTTTAHKTGSTKAGGFPFPKVLLAIVAIFAVLLGIAAMTRNSNKTNTQVHATVQTAQVYVTKSGFIPAIINIKVGTSLTWTNQDSKVHQVAADPYPKNDSIPGLNSTVILNKGDSYSFKFDNAGTYTYHDQKNPLNKSFHGTVVVQ